MNSLDRDLLDQAAEILNTILSEESVATAISRDSRAEAIAWLAKAAAAGVNPPRRQPSDKPLVTRWRSVSSDGQVALEPTPEPPDDPDEGETGPPEQQG